MKLKTKILLGWLALELMTLPFAIPAAAAMMNRVSFKPTPKIIAVPMPSEPGQSVFLVAANTPFAVISRGAMTKLSVNIEQSGRHAGVAFGSKSQMPGDASGCSVPTTVSPSRIYTAGFKTEKRRGSPQETAVKVTVRYNPQARPNISVVSMEKARARNIVLAYPCGMSDG